MFMFGRKKKPEQQNAQIPYEVYATMQQPTARRRAWLMRLAAMLVIVTLLIVGGLFLKRTVLDNKKSPSGTSGQSQSGQGSGAATNQPQPPQTLVQPPQQNAPTATDGSGAATPTTLPQSNAQNTTTVRKPE
jgi:hypothetical protein